MKLFEPFTLFLAFVLLGGALSWHVDHEKSNEKLQLQQHYYSNHKDAYESEAKMNLRHKAEQRAARKFRLKNPKALSI